MAVAPPIAVPDDRLNDLRARLRATRWPRRWPIDGWETGTDTRELQRLVEYWSTGFNWRHQEAVLNELPAHVAQVGGTALHYLLFEAERSDAMPIVLTNGWPSSFLELVTLADHLSRPSAHGRGDSMAFTVVVPSLPGFAFTPQLATMPGAVPTHELWYRLMREELGFDRFAAHGGDLGAGVTSLLAATHPDALTGIHLLAVADPTTYDPGTLTPAERVHLAEVAKWFEDEGAYEHQQMTRPMTLAFALADSPTGLLAWIVEKYRAWSDSDGELSRRFSDDFLLTQASLYWFTDSISTSFRPYYEYAAGLGGRVGRVSVPTAIAVFPKDLTHPPRAWAERTYDVRRYTLMPRGGHFAAHEEPELLADDLRAFFSTLS